MKLAMHTGLLFAPAFNMKTLKLRTPTLHSVCTHRFSIYYVLNKPPEGWKGGVGFVSKDMITSHLPKPASDVLVLRCGPPAMNKAMRAHLNELGYSADMQFEF